MPVSVTRLIPPDQWRKRQITNLQSVGQRSYEQGIDMPKKDPIKAALDAKDKWKNRMQEAMEKGRREKALAKVTSDEWNSYAHAFSDKLVPGVVKREAKVAEFIDSWVPKLQSHLNKIDAMPAATDADMEQRVLENLRGLKALKGSV